MTIKSFWTILSFGAVILSTGCQQVKKTTLAQIETQLTHEHSNHRSIAQDQGPRCLQDSYPNLKAEILALEKEVKKDAFAKGMLWRKTVDLSLLRPSEAHYLKNQDATIYDGNPNLGKGCESIECILTEIYGADRPNSANLAYDWYLKTGIPLATSIKSPREGRFDYYGKSSPYPTNLFSEKELQGFWKLSRMLPPTLANGNRIKSIHRLANGKNFEPPFVQACGINSGWGNDDVIVVTDGCLWFNWKNEDDIAKRSGGFFGNLTHEFAHSADRALVNKNDESASESSEWRDLSGWKLVDEVIFEEPSPGASPIPKQIARWKSDENAKFITQYAGTNPAEDLAESIAIFVTEPSKITDAFEKKVNYVSKNFFQNRRYDNNSHTQYFKSLLTTRLQNLTPVWVNACIGSNENLDSEILFDLPKIPQGISACLSHQFNEAFQSEVARLRRTDWYACDTLETQENSIKKDLAQHLATELQDLVLKQEKLKTFLNDVLAAKSSIEDQIDPFEIYRTCEVRADSKVCFEKSVTSLLNGNLVESLNLDPSVREEATRQFLKNSTYEATQVRFQEIIRSMVAGLEPKTDSLAKSLWSMCQSDATLESQGAGDTPLLTPFSGGSIFVPASILNCVNSRIGPQTEAILFAYLKKRFGILEWDDSTRVLLGREFIPRMVKLMGEELNRQYQADRFSIDQSLSSIILRNDFDKKSLPTTQACEIRAFENALKLEPSLKPRMTFFQKSDLYQFKALAWVCTDVRNLQLIESAKFDLKKLLESKAHEIGNTCRTKFPPKVPLTSKLRRNCFENRWSDQEEASIKAFRKSLSTGHPALIPTDRLSQAAKSMRSDITGPIISKLDAKEF